MRRSIEEVRTELQKRSAEFEKRKRARIKSLSIGAGAALVLLLVAVPVINGSLNSKDGAPMPQPAAYSGSSGTDSAGSEGMNNVKPPRGDGATTHGAPANSEPTAMPGAPGGTGSSGGDTNGAWEIVGDGHYDPEAGMLDWYDEMRGEYRAFPRNGIEPQWAMIVVSDDGGSHTHEIWNSGDAQKLLELFLELHDSAQFFEVMDTIDPEYPRTIEYKVRIIKDDLHFDIIKYADDSFGFSEIILLKPDAAGAKAFDALVAELCKIHK